MLKEGFRIRGMMVFVVGGGIGECIRFLVVKSKEKKDDRLKK